MTGDKDIAIRRVCVQLLADVLHEVTSHSRQCDYTAPLLKFKIEREILVLESSRFGKNYC